MFCILLKYSVVLKISAIYWLASILYHENVILFYSGTDGTDRGVPMKHQAVYTVCVILELYVFLAGSTNIEHESGMSVSGDTQNELVKYHG